VVAFNRAVALAQRDGSARGRGVERIKDRSG
jgi:predicted RNA polymerase sigma factor